VEALVVDLVAAQLAEVLAADLAEAQFVEVQGLR
jgi:hypothetical protein